jgi:hypothetical protein
MRRKKDSYCINHPGRLAPSRCKQCHKPLCNECVINFGEDGLFCSEKCHTVFARFKNRAEKLPYKKKRSVFGALGNFVATIIKLVLVAAAIVVLLMITGNKFGVGLRYNSRRQPVPLEIVLPERSQ